MSRYKILDQQEKKTFFDDSLWVVTEPRGKVYSLKTPTLHLSLVPNPANDYVQIVGIKETDEVQVQIRDMRGLVCREAAIIPSVGLQVGFSVANLPNGIYSCQIIVGNAHPISRKLIVLH